MPLDVWALDWSENVWRPGFPETSQYRDVNLCGVWPQHATYGHYCITVFCDLHRYRNPATMSAAVILATELPMKISPCYADRKPRVHPLLTASVVCFFNEVPTFGDSNERITGTGTLLLPRQSPLPARNNPHNYLAGQ